MLLQRAEPFLLCLEFDAFAVILSVCEVGQYPLPATLRHHQELLPAARPHPVPLQWGHPCSVPQQVPDHTCTRLASSVTVLCGQALQEQWQQLEGALASLQSQLPSGAAPSCPHQPRAHTVQYISLHTVHTASSARPVLVHACLHTLWPLRSRPAAQQTRAWLVQITSTGTPSAGPSLPCWPAPPSCPLRGALRWSP